MIGEIHVKWRGLLGNRLFQLAGGLVLAIESGAKLRALPIPGFPLVQFAKPSPPEDAFQTKDCEPAFSAEILTEFLKMGHHIVVNGHHEQYRHYKDHKAAIRTLLHFQGGSSYAPDPEDLVVHIRLTGANATETYDLNYVRVMIESLKSGKVIIVTDDPSHPFIHEQFRERDVVVVKATTEEDFGTLWRAKRLMLTPSTYGWWAAFLGQAEEVYFPFRQGVWKREYIDLWVDDEPRYIKY